MVRVCTALNVLRADFLLLMGTAVLCAACSSDSEDKTQVTSVLDLQGAFLDAVVSGLEYSAETHNGVTDTDGKFTYRRRETITFAIGDIELGTTYGAQIVSPFDLVPGADRSDHPSIINMLRFLQSLDTDADVSNGIQISAALREAAKFRYINFHQLTAEFAEDQDVIDFVSQHAVNGALVSQADALAHFEEVVTEHELEPRSAGKHRYKVVRNLDPRDPVPFNINGNRSFISSDSTTYNATESFTLLDSFGFEHTAHLYYVKEPLDYSDPELAGLPNLWSLYVEMDDLRQQVGGTDPDNPTAARFVLRFGTNGRLLSETSLVVSNWTPVYNATTDSARPLGPDSDDPLVNDPLTSSNFEIDVSAVKFGARSDN